jgi:hypothetical protein
MIWVGPNCVHPAGALVMEAARNAIPAIITSPTCKPVRPEPRMSMVVVFGAVSEATER